MLPYDEVNTANNLLANLFKISFIRFPSCSVLFRFPNQTALEKARMYSAHNKTSVWSLNRYIVIHKDKTPYIIYLSVSFYVCCLPSLYT